MSRLLYVASLPHSGSTLFTLMMGQHPKVVGLGALDRAVRMLTSDRESTFARPCTCGVSVAHCPFWTAVAFAIDASPPRTLPERYRLALRVFAEKFGADAWPVDPGQIVEPAVQLRSEADLDLRIVHLARDVRSSIVSELDSSRRKGIPFRARLFAPYEIALRWHRENKKIADTLRGLNRPVRGIGYEELSLAFEKVFAAMCDFLGLEPVTPSANVHGGNNHLFIGNRMRAQEEKAKVLYDGRWFTRDEWQKPVTIFPFVLRGNRQWVYGNGIFDFFSKS